jgi:hypothetical protein
MRLRIAICCTLALTLSAPAGALASNDTIGSGTVKLKLDKRFASFLAMNEIQLRAEQGARHKGKAIFLPVAGGSLDPTRGKGEVEATGQIVFQESGERVPLRNIAVKTKSSPLVAKVGGSQLKVATSSRLSSKRAGFATDFTAKALKLSAKAVTRLNKKLRPRTPFATGQPLGTLESESLPKTTTILPQGKGTLVPDPAFIAKLNSLFISLNPISPAELAPGPVLYFPIAPGGQLAPSAAEGTLRFGGAIELLQLGAGQVFHQEYWLDLAAKQASAEIEVQPTPAFPGKLGRIGAFAIDMARAVVSSQSKARTISIQGAPLILLPQTAQTFNEAFAAGKPTFAAGEPFGTVSFVAQGQ